MTTDHITRTRQGVAGGDVDERARRAVKAFRAMQFGLTSYARALTGNKRITVELSSGVPRTDGKHIWYQPPIALGDATPHERRLCDTRDSTGLMQCKACAIREEVLVNIYHEIGHIAFDSFAEVSDKDKSKAIDRAIKEWGGKYAEQIRAKFAAVPNSYYMGYKELSSIISPYLPHLVNCIEDARVDSSMFKARPGVRTMMTADTLQMITRETDTPEGPKTWADMPLNSQAAFGCYLTAAGMGGLISHLHSEVQEAFSDGTVHDLLTEISESKHAKDTYEASFPVLARLRELGFFKLPEDEPEPESEPEEEPQDEQEEDAPSDDTASGDDTEENDDTESDSREEESPEDEQPDAGEGDPGEQGDGESDESGGEGDSAEDQQGADEPGQNDGDADGDREGDSSDGVDDTDGSADRAGGEEGMGEGDPSAGEAGEGEPSTEETSPEGDELDDDSTDEPADSEDGSGDSSGETADEPGGESDQADGDQPPGSDQGEGSESDAAPEQGDPSKGGEDATPGHEEGREPESSEGDDAGESERDPGQADSDGPGSEQGDGESGEDSGLPADDGATGQDEAQDGPGDASELPGTEADGPATEERVEPDAEEASEEVADDGTDVERIDTGADDGMGGLETEVNTPDYGTPEEVADAMEEIHKSEVHIEDTPAEESAVAVAIVQGLYFETPSANVLGVRVHKYDTPTLDEHGHRTDEGWSHERVMQAYKNTRYSPRQIREALGIDCDLDVPETILGPALLATRRVFTDNQTAEHQRNLKSGRIDGKVLGNRAWSGDPRLFSKKRLPGKKNYAVLLGIDCSGSTAGENIALAKRAASAQAELCQRAGVDFAVYAHSANYSGSRIADGGFVMDMYEIKSFNEPWDDNRRNRLAILGSDSGNLDGHSLEFYRKRLDEVEATDKILLYYTDGKMPAANHDEELEILQREIRTCRQRGYTLLGVGIRTDSPIQHGLDTVQVDTDDDLKLVVKHLEKRLVRRG